MAELLWACLPGPWLPGGKVFALRPEALRAAHRVVAQLAARGGTMRRFDGGFKDATADLLMSAR